VSVFLPCFCCVSFSLRDRRPIYGAWWSEVTVPPSSLSDIIITRLVTAACNVGYDS